MKPRPFFHHSSALAVALLSILLAADAALGQGTSFTYQGRLTDGGSTANGNYDLQFTLWDSTSGGNQVGATQTVSSVLISAGIFTVTLDFGTNSFTGGNRYLEISARPSGVGSFTVLTPRQPVTATPYAMRSANASAADALSNACAACVQDSQIGSVSGGKITGTVANAASATSATNATNATNATQLGGIAASQYVQTNDSRLSDPRTPAPGSSNYIQTTPNTAQNANFNISGNGTANALNAMTQYNLGGSRVLGSNGDSTFIGLGTGTNPSNFLGFNTFVGSSAGGSNIQGFNNSLFGFQAGFKNTLGGDDSFFGASAGSGNTSGTENSFFGSGTGFATSNGCCNSFFGAQAGNKNTTGAGNTAIGRGADFGSGDLHNATVIGIGAIVSASNSIVLGRTIDNVGIGVAAPIFKLHVIDPVNTGLRVETDTTGGTVASFGGNGDFQIDAANNVGGRLIVKENGNVGISMPSLQSPQDKLDVNGVVRVGSLGASGSTALCRNASNQISTCSSSLRYKTNVARFDGGLDIVNRLRPISFEWKADHLKDIGLGAEEVAQVEPLLTFRNANGEIEGVKYNQLSAVFINAFKEQQAQIQKQQTELKQAEKRAVAELNELQSLRIANAALDARLQRLEKDVRRQRHPASGRSLRSAQINSSFEPLTKKRRQGSGKAKIHRED